MISRNPFSHTPFKVGSYSLSSDATNRNSRNLYPAVFFEADDGGNPSGGNSPGNETPPKKADNQNPQPSALERAVTDLLARNNNNSDEALRTLVGQNHKLLQRAELAESKVGKIPDDVQAELEAYRAHGKPDEIKTRLDAGDAAITERDSMAREKSVREACELAGIDYADLSTRKGVDDWMFEKKTEKAADGKTDIEVAYVTAKDDKGQDVTKPLVEHAFNQFPTLAKAKQEAEGRRVNPAFSGTPADPRLADEAARKSQSNLYASSNH
jgi:hypothetical protein